MKEWEKLSSAELGALIQRLYLRLEQYEIHARSLAKGTFAREGADALVERYRKQVADACAALDRRTVESIGLDARRQVAQMIRPLAKRDGTSGRA